MFFRVVIPREMFGSHQDFVLSYYRMAVLAITCLIEHYFLIRVCWAFTTKKRSGAFGILCPSFCFTVEMGDLTLKLGIWVKTRSW